jgi:hypothetical protein
MYTREQIEALRTMLEGFKVWLGQLEQDLGVHAAEAGTQRQALTLLLPNQNEENKRD